jgi:hypothetical protein
LIHHEGLEEHEDRVGTVNLLDRWARRSIWIGPKSAEPKSNAPSPIRISGQVVRPAETEGIFRLGYATHPLGAGIDIRTVEASPGRGDVSTAMTNLQPMKRPATGATSPVDPRESLQAISSIRQEKPLVSPLHDRYHGRAAFCRVMPESKIRETYVHDSKSLCIIPPK